MYTALAAAVLPVVPCSEEETVSDAPAFRLRDATERDLQTARM